jgi:hypothetical protein
MKKNIPKGFRLHFLEATEINKIRKIYYSEKTNGKSKWVSNIMIYFEKFLYPVACYFDKKAKKFNQKAIPIIIEDFVSLENILPIDCPPKYQNISNLKEIKKLAKLLFKLRKSVRKSARKYDFTTICRLISKVIEEIIETEKRINVHFAMIKHILESAGYASQNAIIYTENADIEVKKLATSFINIQMQGTILSPLIDREANKIHKLGYGIIVNDIPPIPFEFEKWLN